MLVGFTAQMVDGCLGMAYGVCSNTFLLSMGIPPAAASASVHAAEIFTTMASGLSHFKLGNVDRKLFEKLLVPGIIGGITGAYILVSVPGDALKPFISAYLIIIGIVIFRKAFKRPEVKEVAGNIVPLGLAGGFFDAVGGGGWGPIVTSTLIARGNHPRFTIGSVNTAEFFVTISESFVFILTIGLLHWNIIAGLIIGGVIAAPLAAKICRIIPTRMLMMLVGLVVIALSIRTILLSIG
jgi:uncharacterized membrane protein YfcA